MLDVDKIRQLVEMMVANDLVEISLRDGEVEVNLRRPNPGGPVSFVAPEAISAPVVQPTAPAANPHGDGSRQGAPDDDAGNDGLIEITSPMVGTFYAASDPDSPPYATVGTEVHPGSVVCIVEAMKVFNEIKAEVSGVIDRILVKNEQAIEYGQPLFSVRTE